MDTPPQVTAEPQAKAELTPREVTQGTSPRKDSTNELPMFDLDEALNFVSGIHEKGLETVPMTQVAQGMGYTNPSSTPFYRRAVAARLFGLLNSSRAELTLRAREFLKPTSDSGRREAVVGAVTGITAYAEQVQKHLNKRLNTNFVANSFAKEYGLSDGCAAACARAFESSLKTAGMLASDGTVTAGQSDAVTAPTAQPGASTGEVLVAVAGVKTHMLPLNKQGTRVITIAAPLDITPKEIKRVQRWLEVTLLIDWDDDEDERPEAPTT